MNRLDSKGYELFHRVVDLRDNKYKIENESGEMILDISKIKSELESAYINTRFDLVACDFHYSNADFNGYDVLRWLKNTAIGEKKKIRRARFVSYSSEQDKFTANFDGQNILKLIKLKIDDFYKREELADRAARLLIKEDIPLNLSDHIRDELEKYPDMKFKSTYTKFLDKSFMDIANEIDLGSHHGEGFQKYLVELTVAHIIELNEE